jgi:hypothetical protein
MSSQQVFSGTNDQLWLTPAVAVLGAAQAVHGRTEDFQIRHHGWRGLQSEDDGIEPDQGHQRGLDAEETPALRESSFNSFSPIFPKSWRGG